MKLSTKGKYGLYAMYYLAQHTGDGPQPLKAVSAIGVSEDYLEQLLGNLRRAGLVTTVHCITMRDMPEQERFDLPDQGAAKE